MSCPGRLMDFPRATFLRWEASPLPADRGGVSRGFGRPAVRALSSGPPAVCGRASPLSLPASKVFVDSSAECGVRGSQEICWRRVVRSVAGIYSEVVGENSISTGESRVKRGISRLCEETLLVRCTAFITVDVNYGDR